MSYDKAYSSIKNLFGTEPERILVDHTGLIDNIKPVLDIGAGQGRNSFYLAGNGFQVEAIDQSFTAVETINKIADEKRLTITAIQKDFREYIPDKIYSAILIFGLIQILDLNSVNSLIDNIDKWTETESFVFITAFSTKDPSFKKYSKEWNKAGKNCFTDGKGNFRTFLEKNEILKLFRNFNVLHHWEGLGKKHKHGGGSIEQHEMIELVAQKV